MKVLMVGGGTLGSVTPLLAVAEELGCARSRSGGLQASTHGDLKVAATFWGTRSGPERQFVEAAGIPFRSIPAGKLRRYWDLRNLLDFVVVKWAFWVALIRLIRWRPSVVVGAGSFVQVPVMWAAWVLRISIVIHQLDVRPSLANRLVAPFASKITVTFPASTKAFHRAEVVGAPVRRTILAARDLNPREAKRHFGFTGDRPVLLILGGGTGAQALNELIAAALSALTIQADVLHITGSRKVRIREYAPDAMERYRSFELLTDDLPSAYAAADLVVSRAGMGTIAELAALGKPTVLVPMPGTHQENNAAALVERRAAIALNQRELTSSKLVRQAFALLRDTRHRVALSRAVADLFPSDAASRVAGIVAQTTTEMFKSNPSA